MSTNLISLHCAIPSENANGDAPASHHAASTSRASAPWRSRRADLLELASRGWLANVREEAGRTDRVVPQGLAVVVKGDPRINCLVGCGSVIVVDCDELDAIAAWRQDCIPRSSSGNPSSLVSPSLATCSAFLVKLSSPLTPSDILDKSSTGAPVIARLSAAVEMLRNRWLAREPFSPPPIALVEIESNDAHFAADTKN